MTPKPLPDRDALYRHCVFPYSFKGKKQAKRFDFTELTHFRVEGQLLRASMTWERYAPTMKQVHAVGCRLAESMNLKESKKGTLKKGGERVYCGSYKIACRSIRDFPRKPGLERVLQASAFHKPENGELAHADVVFSIEPCEQFEFDMTKTAIHQRLWSEYIGPLAYKCKSDINLTKHPSSLLEETPNVDWQESRSNFARLWNIVRFLLRNLFWTLFEQERNKNQYAQN